MIKVLIAEDFEVLRTNLTKKLNKEEDIEVVYAAKSGKEIVEAAKQNEFDIVLMDIEMETSMAGIIAAGEILAFKEDAKIIFLTVHEDNDAIIKAIDCGAVDYVVKTNDIQIVIEHIRNAFDSKVVLDSNISMVLNNEYKRLKKVETGLLFFIKNISKLTTAEKVLLKLIVEKNSVSQIAKMRYVEISTIKSQISSILKKLNASRTKEIVKKIEDYGLETLLDELEEN